MAPANRVFAHTKRVDVAMLLGARLTGCFRRTLFSGGLIRLSRGGGTRTRGMPLILGRDVSVCCGVPDQPLILNQRPDQRLNQRLFQVKGLSDGRGGGTRG